MAINFVTTKLTIDTIWNSNLLYVIADIYHSAKNS